MSAHIPGAIFAKIAPGAVSMADLARAVDAAPAALTALQDADHCDPQVVVRLCHHLGLAAPEACPRRDKG